MSVKSPSLNPSVKSVKEQNSTLRSPANKVEELQADVGVFEQTVINEKIGKPNVNMAEQPQIQSVKDKLAELSPIKQSSDHSQS